MDFVLIPLTVVPGLIPSTASGVLFFFVRSASLLSNLPRFVLTVLLTRQPILLFAVSVTVGFIENVFLSIVELLLGPIPLRVLCFLFVLIVGFLNQL